MGDEPHGSWSVSRLLADAAERAGHDDWGDHGFTESLGLLVESCLAGGRLSDVGRRVLRSVVLRHLRNRLYVQAYLDRHPEAEQRALDEPIVITGLPRTGTSLLHNLLAQDPRHRFLRLWEALHPVPPEPGVGPDEAALVGQAQVWLERLYDLAPGFRAVHPLTPQGPEECDALLQNAFASQHFDDMFDAEAYSDWFYGSGLHREYGYYARQLRVLTEDAHDGRRWLLKSPGHVGHLDALLEALPTVTVLHCHRDPAEAVPSYASLILTVRRPNCVDVMAEAVGDQALRRCATAIGRAQEVRAAVGEHRFVDVSFPMLATDPLGAVARIYEQLGRRLEPSVDAAMRRWLVEHPRDRHGGHRYDPQRFGLSAERVRPAFDRYLERFAGLTAC